MELLRFREERRVKKENDEGQRKRYIVILRSIQSFKALYTLHFTPSKLVHSNAISTSLGSISHTAITE